jgi:hypothetical protein
MRFKDNESGQTLAITALCMVGFMGFVAMGVDVGVLFHTRWELQTAADAAATAAAVEYLRNGYNSGAAITVGTAAATANNVNDGNTMTPSVTVNANPISPTSHQGCVGTNCYFEAIVSKPNPTVFYRAFMSIWKGTTSSAFTVAARAVAGTPGSATNCMYLTNNNPTGTAFQASGSYFINAPGCGLYVNTISPSAMSQNGNSGNIDVASVSSVGPASGLSGVNFSSGTVQSVGVIPQTIPFTNITPPTVPTTCPAGGALTASTGPGCYSGSVTIGGGVILQAGTYFFTGDLTINGSVTGHGVAFYLTSNTGTFTVKPGSATLDLTPPTSPLTNPFNGVSVYMPLGNKTTIKFQAGSSTGAISGFIVAPGATFKMQDNGGPMNVGGLVVDNIDDGPAQLNLTGNSSSTSPLKTVSLVE